SHRRTSGKFNRKERKYSQSGQGSWLQTRDITIAEAISRLLDQLSMMGIERGDVIISTNLRTRLDGLPRSDQREPDDPGAAVYWKKRNEAVKCMAIDQYTRVADNLAALAATLEAMRAIERHGGAEILNRAFRGFAALPEKASEPWRDVLALPQQGQITIDQVEDAFRRLAHIHHPDKGGDPDSFRIVDKCPRQCPARTGRCADFCLREGGANEPTSLTAGNN